jgi:plasmid stability protein
MGQLLVRNLDNDIIEAIKLKAELNGRSLEQELREILRLAAPLTPEQRVVLSRRIRSMQSGRASLDSTVLIRATRDDR